MLSRKSLGSLLPWLGVVGLGSWLCMAHPPWRWALLSTGNFMPHGHCYLDDPRMIWLQVTTDSAIGLAYIAISLTLVYLVYRARKEIPFRWVLIAFGLFIIACGGTHLMEVVTVWHPLYWLSGSIKVVTAIASVATALALPPLLPKIFALIEADRLAHERKGRLENAHRELQTMHGELKTLDQLKSQFFANISHELRTPLALILAPAEQLRMSSNLEASQHECLEVIRRNAKIMQKHVNDLLDAAKLDAHKMEVAYSEFDLAWLVRLIASDFDALAKERGVHHRLELPPTFLVQADQTKTERVLVNLLANAFRFVPEGGKVRTSLRHEGTQAVLEVADSGPGVPVQLRRAIFERFRQGDGSTTRPRGGTGLGLAIAHEFVALQRGGIEVRDAPEGGALFRVSLPVQAPEGTEIAPEQWNQRSAESTRAEVEIARGETGAPVAPGEAWGQPDSSRPLVLIVEDNRDMSQHLCRMLKDTCRTVQAFDGAQGVAKARALRPDLLLTDIMMPEMSGDELVRTLRSDRDLDPMPIVILTAKADEQLRSELLRHGAQDYLIKPFGSEELLARTNNLLTSKRRLDGLEEARQELEAFSYSISHDMRAPLRAMRGYAEMLLEKWSNQLGDEGKDYAQRILRASDRLDRLVRDVLRYSSVAKLPLELHEIDLEQVVQEIIQENRVLQSPQAEVEVVRPLGLVLGHSAFVVQCMSNLLSNGAKFVNPGTVPRLRIWTEPAGSAVRLWIQDNGIGIDPSNHERVFGLFQRLNRQFDGTGIGLTIVRKAVERMGGKVGLESKLKEGCRFWVELPKPEARELA